MIITKKSIRSCDKYLNHIKEDENIIIGIKISDIVDKNILNKIGFSKTLEVGECILPSYLGPKTKFNGEGKSIPLKNEAKETFYIFREWKWEDFTGKKYCEIISIPRKRYPRKIISAPGMELNIGENSAKEKYIYMDSIKYSSKNHKEIIHAINMMLEIFKFCYIFTEDFVPTLIPIKKLNWKILPSGIKTWQDLEEKVLSSIKYSKKVIYENRLKFLKTFNPDFVAVGNGGFSGYIVFGFEDRNLYILENLWYGNATYLFNENWKILSQLTKTEILFNNLFTDRIVHTPNWENQLKEILL